MKVSTLALICASCALFSSAYAQVRAPSGDKQMEAKRMAWQTWRRNHTNVLDLQHTVISLAEMQDDPTLRASAGQAKDLLKIVNAWKARSSLSDKRARLVDSEIKALLSQSQLAAIRNTPKRYTAPPVPQKTGLPGSGRPSVSTREFPWPKDYNPLLPETIPFRVQRSEMKALVSQLVKQLQSYSA